MSETQYKVDLQGGTGAIIGEGNTQNIIDRQINVYLPPGNPGSDPEEEKRAEAAARRAEELILLCDRTHQANDFILRFKNNAQNSQVRPQIYFICGLDTDHNAKFVIRLVKRELQKEFGPIPLPRVIEWPEQVRDADPQDYPIIEEMLRDNLLRAFIDEKKYREIQNQGAEALQKAYDDGLAAWVGQDKLVTVQIKIPHELWGELSSRLLTRFMNYWAAQHTPQTLFVAFLSLIYPSSLGLNGTHLPRKMCCEKSQLPAPPDIFWYQVPPLGPVGRKEAGEWIGEYVFQGDIGRRNRAIWQIYKVWPAMRMDPLQAKLKKIYDEQRRNINH